MRPDGARDTGGPGPSSPARLRLPDNAAVTRVVFGAFTVGLAGSITLSQGSLIALILLWLWRLRDPAARRMQPWPLRWPLLAFVGIMLLSALASEAPGQGLLALRGLFAAAAIYVTIDVVRTTERAERFLTALAVLVAVSALIGIVQVAVCPATPPEQWPLSRYLRRCDRAHGPFSIYMTLGGVLATVLLVILPRWLPGGPGPRWLVVPWLVMLLGLGATYVRGAWLGFGAGVAALLTTLRRGRWLLLLGFGCLVVTALLGPERLSQRLRSMGDPDEVTILERRYMWQSGFAMWREHPWLGVGPGGVKRRYEHYARPEAIKKRTGHLHSSPLQILVEGGVLALAAWLWIWLAFFWSSWRLLRRLGDPAHARERALVAGSLAAIAGFLVTGLSEWSFGDSEVVLVAWTLMALPSVAARRLDGDPARPAAAPAARPAP